MRDARGAWTSKGRRLLIAALQSTTGRVIARRCRVVPSAISQLASGARLEPKLRLALALQHLYGIDAETWLEEDAVEVHASERDIGKDS